ncbi:alpha/beta fold hydrolase [Rhizobium esperanzae]|uniref:Pimeloyl-ACP methyl ester carboxylesterase n=1 Tax=Rhizobium esperanzae TaxID=1967781 RepID=A0A7W6R3A6_9HYPH|nr:alpha/beta hydrolase [Rhizobium esperanzae]MBB4235877.1 pimeloyl-ACP methyl ester carboxylesterase [Rhizobium esperanzae]
MKFLRYRKGTTDAHQLERARPAVRPLRHLAALVGVTVAISPSPTEATKAPVAVRNIVLVHGAFADGSSWAAVVGRLQARGYRVTAVQNPLTSLADDVAATNRVLRRQTGDVLLVGHSWAGAVITEAGNASNVKGLVYLSALVPDSGESVADLLQRLNAPMSGLTPDPEGLIWLDDADTYRQVMAADVTAEKAAELAALQQPIAAAAFSAKIGHAAWQDKPSWYLRTENDNALPPAVQQTMAEQIDAQITSIPSSHMSLVSHPDAVVDLIDRAAQQTGQ